MGCSLLAYAFKRNTHIPIFSIKEHRNNESFLNIKTGSQTAEDFTKLLIYNL